MSDRLQCEPGRIVMLQPGMHFLPLRRPRHRRIALAMYRQRRPVNEAVRGMLADAAANAAFDEGALEDYAPFRSNELEWTRL